jgi:hypothetical protein
MSGKMPDALSGRLRIRLWRFGQEAFPLAEPGAKEHDDDAKVGEFGEEQEAPIRIPICQGIEARGQQRDSPKSGVEEDAGADERQAPKNKEPKGDESNRWWRTRQNSSNRAKVINSSARLMATIATIRQELSKEFMHCTNMASPEITARATARETALREKIGPTLLKPLRRDSTRRVSGMGLAEVRMMMARRMVAPWMMGISPSWSLALKPDNKTVGN